MFRHIQAYLDIFRLIQAYLDILRHNQAYPVFIRAYSETCSNPVYSQPLNIQSQRYILNPGIFRIRSILRNLVYSEPCKTSTIMLEKIANGYNYFCNNSFLIPLLRQKKNHEFFQYIYSFYSKSI